MAYELTLEDIFQELLPRRTAQTSTKAFYVPCDLEESEGHYQMSFDLPGVSKEDVKIEAVENTLTVSGERRMERGDKTQTHFTERRWGTFECSFKLPNSIDLDKIEARFNDGVLNIVIPKAEASRPRQIKIT